MMKPLNLPPPPWINARIIDIKDPGDAWFGEETTPGEPPYRPVGGGSAGWPDPPSREPRQIVADLDLDPNRG